MVLTRAHSMCRVRAMMSRVLLADGSLRESDCAKVFLIRSTRTPWYKYCFICIAYSIPRYSGHSWRVFAGVSKIMFHMHKKGTSFQPCEKQLSIVCPCRTFSPCCLQLGSRNGTLVLGTGGNTCVSAYLRERQK